MSSQFTKKNQIKSLDENKMFKFSNQNIKKWNSNDTKIEETGSLFRLDRTTDYLLKYFFTSIIQFARSIPFFNLISNEDQIVLLQNCWHELFILSLTQSKILIEQIKELSISSLCEPLKSFSVEINSSASENTCKSEICSEIVKSHAEKFDALKIQMEKIRLFNLTNEEYCYLKAILLFNSGDYFEFQRNRIPLIIISKEFTVFFSIIVALAAICIL